MSKHDLENLLYLTKAPAVRTSIVCRAARSGYMDFVSANIQYVSLGDIMSEITLAECHQISRLPPQLLKDVSKKDLITCWPVYDKYRMELFAALRVMGYTPHMAFRIHNLWGI